MTPLKKTYSAAFYLRSLLSSLVLVKDITSDLEADTAEGKNVKNSRVWGNFTDSYKVAEMFSRNEIFPSLKSKVSISCQFPFYATNVRYLQDSKTRVFSPFNIGKSVFS